MSLECHCTNPACGRRYVFPDASAGRSVRCNACGQTFVASKTVEAPHKAPPSPPTPAAVAPPPVVVPPVVAKAPAPLPPAPAAVADVAVTETNDGLPLPTDPSTVRPGNVILASALDTSLGRFIVRNKLGAGAFGTVYRAYDPHLDREVALKVPNPGAMDTPRRVERFLREAKAAARLRHPHIVPVFDAGQDGDRYYIASAFIDGQPLAEAIPEGGMEFERAARLVRELAEALAYAHEQGIVHRDVKPQNVMLDKHDRVHLMDFGLAARHDEEARLTADGTVMGTACYMAPEQAAGKKGEAQGAVDQYAAGVVLYELLTGRTPFSGPIAVVLHNAIHTEPDPPQKFRPNVPKDLETICLKAMAKRPEDRYADCQALADDLRRWLDGEPITARELSFRERAARWIARKPMQAGLVLMGLFTLGLLGFTVSVAGLWLRAEKARDSAEAARITAEAAQAEAEHARQEALEARDKAKDAANGAEEERKKAEKARDDEKKARGEAEEERKKAETAQKATAVALKDAQEAQEKERIASAQVARVVYGRTMQVAHQNWKDNNIAGAQALLDDTKPELRGWEWHYLQRLCAFRPLEFKGHTGKVTSACYSPDGTTVLTTSADKTARLWESGTGKLLRTLNKHDGPVGSGWFSPSGKKIVTVSADGTARVWDTVSGDEVAHFKGHKGAVLMAAFSPDESRVITGGSDGTARVWSVATNKELFPVAAKEHTGDITGVTFLQDNERVATAGADGTVRIWNTKIDTRVYFSVKHPGGVKALALSADGAKVASAGTDGLVRIWDKNGTDSFSFDSRTKPVVAVAFNRDGSQIVTVGEGKAVIWDAKSGAELFNLASREVARLPGWVPGAVLHSAAFSPDGSKIVSGFGDNLAIAWDSRSGSELSAAGPTTKLPSLRINHGGKRVLLEGDTVRLEDVDGVLPAIILKGHSQKVNSASWNADGTRVVSASADGTAIVWDAKSGVDVLVFRGHGGEVKFAAFSFDGSKVVTVDKDNTVRTWDAGSAAATGPPEPKVPELKTPEPKKGAPKGGVGVGKIDPAKLVGTWEPKEQPPELKDGTVQIEFTNAGKFRIHVSPSASGTPVTLEGTYSLNGDKLTIDLKMPGDANRTSTLLRLTDTEVEMQDKDGKSVAWKRVKPKP